jgi:hypothetical protein
MQQKLSIEVLRTRRAARLRELADVGPVLQGSFAQIRVTCGNPNCRCARGEKHTSHILKRQVRGRTQSLYVPVDMVEEVRQWVNEYRRVQRLLAQISDLNRSIISAHVPTRRARAANRAIVERVRKATGSSR